MYSSKFAVTTTIMFVMIIQGCASISGWQTEKAGTDFKNGTRVLGELVYKASHENIQKNEGRFNGAKEKLLTAGYSESEIEEGSVVTIFTYCYGHNSMVPICRHSGYYIAYIPGNPDRRLTYSNDVQNENKTGDLVEIELTRTEKGDVVGKFISVYRKSGEWNECHGSTLKARPINDAIMSFSVGPPRAAWIECDGIEKEGWTRQPVPGAPFNTGTPVSEWIK